MAINFTTTDPDYGSLADSPPVASAWTLFAYVYLDPANAYAFNPENPFGIYNGHDAESASAQIDANGDLQTSGHTAWMLRINGTNIHAQDKEVTLGWHKVWLTYNGTDTVNMYIDDPTTVVETGTVTFSNDLGNRSLRWACRAGTNGSFPCTMRLGRFTAWTALLTQTERQAEEAAGISLVKSSNLFDHYTNLQGATQGIGTVNGQNFTLNGSPEDVADPTYATAGIAKNHTVIIT